MQNPSAVQWLTGLILGASTIERPGPPSQGTITSPSGQTYQVLQKLGSTECYNLYQCLLESGQRGVLKVALSTELNSALDREALVLKLMYERALEVDRKSGSKSQPFNYQFQFPRLHESFIALGQNNRRINILGFLPEEVDGLNQLSPVSQLVDKERVRVDPKTCAWILGKSLRILAFAHDQGISNGLVTGSNILIERGLHGVVFFDWTLAKVYSDGRVPAQVARGEIAQAVSLAITIMGGNPKTGEIPPSDQLPDDRFQRLLHQLSQGEKSSASAAHNQFYKLIYELWPRGFHPFTSYPL